MKLLYIFMGIILILIIVGEFLILCGILTLKKQSIKSQELIDRGSKLIWASVLMFIPVVIPIVFFWSAQTTKIKDHIGSMGDWIGFWGSYIGSMIGVIGAVGISYWTTKKQLVESKKNDFENQIKLADLSRLSEAITILKKCDNKLNQLKKKVKKHDYNFSEEMLDNDYDNEIAKNYLNWIVEDGKNLGIIVDDFLMEFTTVIRGLDRSKYVILENKIETFKSEYSKSQKSWEQKVSELNYKKVIKVYDSFVNLKKAFDSISKETLNFYMDIRKK